MKKNFVIDILREAHSRRLNFGTHGMHGTNRDTYQPMIVPPNCEYDGAIWRPIIVEGTKIAHCPLGVLHLVVHNWDETQAISCYLKDYLHGDPGKGIPYKEVERNFEEPLKAECPECGKQLSLITSALVHLGDCHKWSYLSIAKFLDGQPR